MFLFLIDVPLVKLILLAVLFGAGKAFSDDRRRLSRAGSPKEAGLSFETVWPDRGKALFRKGFLLAKRWPHYTANWRSEGENRGVPGDPQGISWV